MVACPVCGKAVKEININSHLDASCTTFIETPSTTQQNGSNSMSNFFKTPAKKTLVVSATSASKEAPNGSSHSGDVRYQEYTQPSSTKRSRDSSPENIKEDPDSTSKRVKSSTSANLAKAAPLAERMRPYTLDDILGQDLVGPDGVLRGLIETNRVPSIILWGDPGTGKTTIARVLAHQVGGRFVEVNSTSSGVNECKKIFAEARNELSLTGRKTVFFCDEIHRFSKSQQDVFLGPVEAGQITLIGATTENPSFKVVNALLSRCRTFKLAKLSEDAITAILTRALRQEGPYPQPPLLDEKFLTYLSAFSDGDARTALNLLELAISLSARPGMTLTALKSSLTKTLVYDRAGDQHYDTISALHKSIRGSDPNASLYYLARMLTSGEDPLYIARRLIVVASEDVGLADNSLLSIATAAYFAAEKLGMPECRINLAHATVALALAPKSTRSYRGLKSAEDALEEPGMAALPIPIHLRNAPTKMMRELGYGKEYKYPPDYEEGRVRQEYLPEGLKGRRFLDEWDLGDKVDENPGGEEEGEDDNREEIWEEGPDVIYE